MVILLNALIAIFALVLFFQERKKNKARLRISIHLIVFVTSVLSLLVLLSGKVNF